MNKGCMLDGAVVQYGLTCCSEACSLRGLGTFDAETSGDAHYRFWTSARATEFRNTGQCRDDREGRFTGVAINETGFDNMFRVVEGWYVNHFNTQSQTTNYVHKTVLGRDKSMRELVQFTTAEQNSRNDATVTQLVEAIGLGTQCHEFHTSGSNQSHTMNCIPRLVRHAL